MQTSSGDRECGRRHVAIGEGGGTFVTSRKNHGGASGGWWIALGTIILVLVFTGVLIWSYWTAPGTAYVN
jgi:hypothetical protein